ncbi:MAG: PBP1A family penicillin-binding protein [Ignavibacteria bacterium]|nr:PBP1A family penicillin-binding protein [Ignavibacteria bacterium]MBK6419665.1 PBP1A family penicillin-binding protein [Ignavibacteria bacterium]MBK7413396.1 PBP1A family penicillin-binding protein [Ignavibacteria bacterium]MBK7576898.1 PBP1A family penicillin-binding protein [Ignavibacteria bacterium]MBP7094151.1 PBP1A family penicillin-binding protein [Candidatus Kapabacteria bacterium]
MKRPPFFTPGNVLRYGLWSIGGVALITLIFVLVVLSDGLPTLEQLENPRQDLATQVYSSDGILLEHFATTRRTYIPFDSIPKGFVNALIATEDRAFYDHWGVHSMRILKAAVKNVFALRAKEGASTITQQLARNLYFTQEQTLARKVREAWTALQVERTYTKNEILEMYANTVYYGRGAYGIRVASQVYFNKEPMRLSVGECAYLVGLFKAPEKYNSDDSLGISRRNLILQMMLDEGFINEGQWAKASSEPLVKPSPTSVFRGIAPHFAEMIRQLLGREGSWADKLKGHDLYRDGLVIHTTLDSRVQRYANDAMAEHLGTYQKTFDASWSWKSKGALLNSLLDRAIAKRSDYIAAKGNARKRIADRYKRTRGFVDSVKREMTVIQAGLVVIDPRTGAILALVGASPLSMKLNPAARYSLNHVTQIRRQPGSSFKPFVYASALEQGLTPETTVESGPFTTTLSDGTVWAPRGSSKEGGPVSLRTALKFSTNSVAARLITEHTTPGNVVSLCQRLGISSPLQAVPSIALGSVEVSPLELTSAYAAFVNDGVHVPPAFITKIEDRMGNVLYEARLPNSVNDALSPNVASNMISLMRGVVDGGTASSIRRFYKGDAAGKTGTTNDFADAWFVGVTPQLACGVWIGFDDRRVQFTGDYGQGGRAAAPVWGRLMQKVYNDPTVPWRRSSFAVARDSTDTVGVEVMINPPSDEIDDHPQDTTQ